VYYVYHTRLLLEQRSFCTSNIAKSGRIDVIYIMNYKNVEFLFSYVTLIHEGQK
jgi:hypothetical protein